AWEVIVTFAGTDGPVNAIKPPPPPPPGPWASGHGEVIFPPFPPWTSSLTLEFTLAQFITRAPPAPPPPVPSISRLKVLSPYDFIKFELPFITFAFISIIPPPFPPDALPPLSAFPVPPPPPIKILYEGPALIKGYPPMPCASR